jgi:tetratricopeptide (TPR) repeat protein
LLIVLLCAFSNVTVTDIQTAMVEKDYAKARQLSEALLAKGSPKNQLEEARYYLGVSLVQLTKYTEAQNAFEQVIRHSNQGALRDQAYLGLIDARFLDGQYDKALEAFKKFLSASPRSDFSSLAYLKGARIYLKMARWQDADGYLRKIVNQYPNSPEAGIARQFLEEKQYFAVQVGAFLERGRAETLSLELRDKGEYAYVVETVDAQGRKFYRVRVGKLALLKEAENLKGRLSTLGYPTAIYP